MDDPAGAPAAPTSLAGTSGDSQVSLTWVDPVDADLDVVRVYRDASLLTTVDEAVQAYVDTSAVNGVSYVYTVRSVDDVGQESVDSNSQNVTPADVTAPAAPSSLAAVVVSDTAIDLTWTDPVDADLVSVRIYRDAALVNTVAAGTQAYSDTGLTASTAYTYTVRAIDEVPNESGDSNSVTPTTDAAAGSDFADDFAAVSVASFDMTKQGGTDTSSIATLTDQSPNANNATQATGSKQPVVATVSGMKVARFDAVDDVVTTAAFSPNPSQPNTMVVLAKYGNGPSGTSAMVSGRTSGNQQAITSAGNVWNMGAGAPLDSATADDANWHVFVATYNGASSELFLDGVSIATGDAGTHTPDGLNIGANVGGSLHFWDGDVNFVGLYDGDLVADNVTLLNDLGEELAARAGISWTTITAAAEFADQSVATFDMSRQGGTDTTAIATLTDYSPNGYDATQATGSKQPTVQTVSGMKVARLDGVDDAIEAQWPVRGQPNTVVALVRLDATSSFANLYDGPVSATRNRLRYNAGTWRIASNSDLGGDSVDLLWHVHVAVYDNASGSSYYIDGGTPTSGSTGGNGSEGLVIGSTIGQSSAFWDGDINFLGVYDGDLKTTDLTLLNALGQELADRAGITWTDIT